MKKTAMLLSFVCTALLLCATPVFAAFEQSGEKGITGTDWLASSQDVKLSFLLGVEATLAAEYSLDEAKATAKKVEVEVSPFMAGWIKAFSNSTRPQIMEKIDAYLLANPKNTDRHVFDIIWTELILPVYPEGKNLSAK